MMGHKRNVLDLLLSAQFEIESSQADIKIILLWTWTHPSLANFFPVIPYFISLMNVLWLYQ
jgi:hypothetical protein